ncbi:Uncharacterized protein FWK35_00033409, partial [Aphis craccivora]
MSDYYESISEFIDSINHTIENHFNLNIMCTNIRKTWHNAVDNSYNITGYNTYYSLIKRNQNDESNILKLSVITRDNPIAIYCIYRSPSNNCNLFIDRLRNIFNDLKSVNECTIVIGDMNIDIRGKVNNEYLDTMAQYGFKSFVNIFTRIPVYGVCSCLDHIFIKAPQEILDNTEASVIQTQITDHFSLIMTMPIYNNSKKEHSTYRKINYEVLGDNLKDKKWDDVYNNSNIDKCVDFFYDIILNSIDKASSLEKVNSKNKRIKEWMTVGLLKSTRKKHELSKKVKKHPENTNLLSYYKIYRNKLACLIKAAKIKLYKDKFFKVAGSPKLTWNLINKLTGAKNVNNNAGNLIYINNNGQCINVQKDPVTTANIFNNFFINIGKEYSAKFKNKIIDRCNVTCDFSFNEQFLVPTGKDNPSGFRERIDP